jgi:hypothetical protein
MQDVDGEAEKNHLHLASSNTGGAEHGHGEGLSWVTGLEGSGSDTRSPPGHSSGWIAAGKAVRARFGVGRCGRGR